MQDDWLQPEPLYESSYRFLDSGVVAMHHKDLPLAFLLPHSYTRSLSSLTAKGALAPMQRGSRSELEQQWGEAFVKEFSALTVCVKFCAYEAPKLLEIW